MSGTLTILLISAEADRARAALTLAMAAAALGERVTLFAQERAVAMLVPGADTGDEALAAAGLPGRGDLLAMAAEAGVRLVACQTGLALCGLAVEALADGVEAGGLVGVLAEASDGRIVVV